MEIKFCDFDKKYVMELNAWQNVEEGRGEFGLRDYVGVEGVLLGDYIDFVSSEAGIETKVALSEDRVVEFVSYVKKKGNEIYVELIGVNPSERGNNIAERIMSKLKSTAGSANYKITFRVKDTNIRGLKAFSKFSHKNKDLTYDGYTGFEY